MWTDNAMYGNPAAGNATSTCEDASQYVDAPVKKKVKSACWRLKPTSTFFGFIWVWRAVIGLKLTSEKAGIGLRRESVDFPDIQKVETLILVILSLN